MNTRNYVFLAYLLMGPALAVIFWTVWTGRSNFWRSLYRSGPLGPALTSAVPGSAVLILLDGLSLLMPGNSVLFRQLAEMTNIGWYGVVGLYFGASLFNWMRPPWFKAEVVARGPGYNPHHALLMGTTGDKPADVSTAAYRVLAQLLTEDKDRPVIGAWSFGRTGHIWLFSDRVEFRQNRMETEARGDTMNLKIGFADLENVNVIDPERTFTNFRLLMSLNARGHAWRWPLLEIATRDGQSHTLWVRRAEEVRLKILDLVAGRQ